MAIPTYVGSSAGAALTGATGTHQKTGVTVGNFLILQGMNDGTTNASMAADGVNIESINGLASRMTSLVSTVGEAVGSPTAALQHIWGGRATGTTVTSPTINLTDDIYVQFHEFANVNTGTTAAAILENGTAGVIVNGVGTSVTVADTGVTTLDVDRLALNFVGINDDGTGIAAFAGETGGDWTMPATFESATGTDGTVALMIAAMTAAGTINGGTATITSDAWGVVGFALIGTPAPPADPPTLFYVTA